MKIPVIVESGIFSWFVAKVDDSGACRQLSNRTFTLFFSLLPSTVQCRRRTATAAPRRLSFFLVCFLFSQCGQPFLNCSLVCLLASSEKDCACQQLSNCTFTLFLKDQTIRFRDVWRIMVLADNYPIALFFSFNCALCFAQWHKVFIKTPNLDPSLTYQFE